MDTANLGVQNGNSKTNRQRRSPYFIYELHSLADTFNINRSEEVFEPILNVSK